MPSRPTHDGAGIPQHNERATAAFAAKRALGSPRRGSRLGADCLVPRHVAQADCPACSVVLCQQWVCSQYGPCSWCSCRARRREMRRPPTSPPADPGTPPPPHPYPHPPASRIIHSLIILSSSSPALRLTADAIQSSTPPSARHPPCFNPPPARLPPLRPPLRPTTLTRAPPPAPVPVSYPCRRPSRRPWRRLG